MTDDPVLAALDELMVVARANIVDWVGVMTRVDEVKELRGQGCSYAEMELSSGVSIVEAISTNQERLTAAAARFRRAAVKQLHDEGMATAAIARAFGVSRQRVSALLGDEPDEGATAVDA